METHKGSNIETLPIGKLRKVADLIYFDGPLLSLFKDFKDENYLYYWCDSDAQANRWLIFRVTTEHLNSYLNHEVSLRSLIFAADAAKTFLVDLDNQLQHLKVLSVSPDDLSSAYLPDEDSLYEFTPRYFSDSSVTQRRSTDIRGDENHNRSANDSESREPYKIYLDGLWNLTELADFPYSYSKAYAFLYSLRGDQELFRQQYNSQPWKGGFSTVNFYQGLQSRIPLRDRPHIVSIQYASPGWIELALIRSDALTIKELVSSYITYKYSLKALYTDIYNELRRRELLRHKFEEREEYGEENIKFVKQSSQELAALLKIDDSLSKISGLTEDSLITLKMILSFYRIIRELSEFQIEGKVEF